jgi:hypothetical protein
MAARSPGPLPKSDRSSLAAWFAKVDGVLADHERDGEWVQEVLDRAEAARSAADGS